MKPKKSSKHLTSVFVIQFWIEKLILLVDFIQIFGIIWVVSQPWPWPFLWISWTKWTVYFNLDFFSLTNTGAIYGRTSDTNLSPYGSMNGYPIYSFIFSIVLLIPYGIIYSVYRLENAYGKRYDKYKPYIMLPLLLLAYYLYIPMSLALIRLYDCITLPSNSAKVLSSDHSVLCGSSLHITFIIINTCLQIPYLLGFPMYLYHYLSRNMIHTNKYDHEKQLQIWELLYIYRTNTIWLDRYIWLLSSLTYTGRYFYLHTVYYKIILLFSYIALRFSYLTQSTIIWLSTCIYIVYYGFLYRPYRSFTSNILIFITLSLLFINVCFATANAYEVKNGIMVASIESIWLLVFHVIGVLLILLVLITCWLNEAYTLPCIQTYAYIQHSSIYKSKVKQWTKILKLASNNKLNFTITNSIICDIYTFESNIRKLHTCWIEAKKLNSLFVTPLGDLLEDCLEVHTQKKVSCCRMNIEWDKIYIQCCYEHIFARRRERLLYINKTNKKLLNIALAIRGFYKYKKPY